MISKNKKNSIIDLIVNFFKNNLKITISIFLFLFLIIILYQYYFYQKNKKPLDLSKLYDQVKSDTNSSDFEKNMNNIAEENGVFGILASLEIINNSLKNHDYNFSYNEYLKLLKSNKSKIVYNNIIALHGAYRLIDYISSEKILNLLSFVNESSISFIGYKYEIEYLLSIKNNNIEKSIELSNLIINNENISKNIKERVKKINEFKKYQ